jgi:DNA-nicking Smr family endonuclease
MRRELTEADRAAWAGYASTVKPLANRSPMDPTGRAGPTRAPPASSRPAPARRLRSVLPPISIGLPPPGLDAATWQRFRTGKLPPTRRLDLHGYTAQRAVHGLASFLRSAHAAHVRCVEVITGRGSSGEVGVIRREFPLWLNLPETRPLILAAVHPHSANPGAVRLLLQRRMEMKSAP